MSLEKCFLCKKELRGEQMEFGKWWRTIVHNFKHVCQEDDFNILAGDICLACQTIENTWIEARKGYVELSKVEEVLNFEDTPCPCDGSTKDCDYLICGGYVIKKLKALHNTSQTQEGLCTVKEEIRDTKERKLNKYPACNCNKCLGLED